MKVFLWLILGTMLQWAAALAHSVREHRRITAAEKTGTRAEEAQVTEEAATTAESGGEQHARTA